MASLSGEPRHADGARLAARTPRLRLLLAHLAGRAVRARVDVEDLVQEVFLRALAHEGGLPPAEEGERPLDRFLARIARNTVVDVARALRRRKRDGAEAPLVRSDWSRAGVTESAIPGSGPGPATRVARAERDEHLARAYERLSADHRRVLGLRQFQGLPASECASRMGRSETAVHSLYRRALQAWAEAAGDLADDSSLP